MEKKEPVEPNDIREEALKLKVVGQLICTSDFACGLNLEWLGYMIEDFAARIETLARALMDQKLEASPTPAKEEGEASREQGS